MGKRYSGVSCFRDLKALMIAAVIIISMLFVGTAAAQDQVGKITGQVVDQETGEPLPGATVMLEGTTTGTRTDLDGNFTIPNVPVGTYNVVISMIGYNRKTVTDLKVEQSDIANINLSLTSEAIKVQDEVVTAKRVRNTGAALLKERQKSINVSDAISAEEISRYGGGDAAEAMKQITGASVVGGKYVFVRGLGERYSNTQLNGVELPSADPDRKAFNMDLLPTNLLDNIVVKKTFTPDQPGSFTGGIVDIGTKSYPENFTLKVSTGTSYREGVTGNNEYLTYPGGDTDWLGMDDGTRDVPDELADENIVIPDLGAAFTNAAAAQELDRLTNSFNNIMGAINKSAPSNKSFSMSVGNQQKLLGIPFGYLGSFSYKRSYSFYKDGEINQWDLPGNVGAVDSLNLEFAFEADKGTDDVLWGGLAMMSLKPHPNHEISTNILYTQSGKSTAFYIDGHFYDGNISDTATYQSRALRYTERKLNSFQLRGHHVMSGLPIPRFDFEWMGSIIDNSQNEPDERFFTNHYYVNPQTNDTTYAFAKFTYRIADRYYRELEEDGSNFSTKISFPFKQWQGLSSKFSLGYAYQKKDRSQTERLFPFDIYDESTFNGDPSEYFETESGIIDTSGSIPIFGLYVSESTEERSQYTGNSEVQAYFGMVELPITRWARFIGGARFESTDMNTVTEDITYGEGIIDENDVLTSASMVFNVKETMNVRIGYGKTLGRPTMREMAPFPSYEWGNGYYFTGNPDLERTLIDNMDLRWEWFTSPGEIYAFSLFYKIFENPIERAFINENGEIKPINVDEGRLYGLELEVRQSLDIVHSMLSNFQFGGNFTIIESRVDIPPQELELIRAYENDPDTYRPMWNQSPYLINLNLGYENTVYGTRADLSFNSFGKRLSSVTIGGTPDVYEKARNILNFSVSQNVMYGLKLKAGIKNILNASEHQIYEFKGNEFTYRKNPDQRTWSFSLSYNIGQ